MTKRIIVVDFGGQYAHLIARRIRECGAYSEIHSPHSIPHDEHVVGIIFSGGPRSVTESDILSATLDINNAKVPLLGICYGHQLIAHTLGGKVSSLENKEYGRETLACNNNNLLFNGTPEEQQVWMSHGDSVETLPPDFVALAKTETTGNAAYMCTNRPVFGVQFHPEVTHSEFGMTILQNFVDLCMPEKNWNTQGFTESMLTAIRQQAAGKKLLLLISGGVDSLVALALCIKAVGNENVFAVHVDTGFMRYKESEEVMQFLDTLGFKQLQLIDAGEEFFNSLQGVTNPEQKRKIIGALFVETMHKALHGYQFAADAWMLVQGTIYPDTIESGGTANASAIKTHHNRVKEIDDLINQGLVIEPLKELYKDEVRALGMELGLPRELVQRRPFPGPGLAIRILTGEHIETLDRSEEIAIAEYAKQSGFSSEILPVKSVGVQGDFRTYRHPVLLQDSNYESPRWNEVLACARNLINTYQSINRVVYAIQPIDEVLKMQPVYLTRDKVAILQLVDDAVQRLTKDISEIWQFPVVSLPLFTSAGKQAFVLRPICSQDAMTADVYPMHADLLEQIRHAVAEIEGAGPLLYDVTTKPPATIEWE